MASTNEPVVLITGALSGIGLACARHLAGHGYRVYGTSRRATLPIQDLSPPGKPFALLSMDVTDDQSVKRGIAAILGREGRLDVVVNNAGMGIAGPVEETSIEEARRQIEVNFFGALRVCRAAIPEMRRQGSGSIVNIGSIGGCIAIPYQALYSASKFALEGLSEGLRLELRGMGIHVVLIQPGDHKTNFTDNRQIAAMAGQAEVYSDSFRAALEKMVHDEQTGPSPERVARLLFRILQSRNPRLRYTVGPPFQRAAVWFKRLLPYGLTEHGIRKYYRIG